MKSPRSSLTMACAALALASVFAVHQPSAAQPRARQGNPTPGANMRGGSQELGPAAGGSSQVHRGGSQGAGGPPVQTNLVPPQAGQLQGPMGPGRGKQGGGPGGPQGAQSDPKHAIDMKAIQFLMINRAQIRRTVVNRPDGVETLTESDNPMVTAVLVQHVEAMYNRVKDQRPIHIRDPLFAELFRNAPTLDMKVERTANGVKVVETSANPDSAKLIQAHAQVVSLFLANGPIEMRKNHPLPK
jgi:hypothetical protein